MNGWRQFQLDRAHKNSISLGGPEQYSLRGPRIPSYTPGERVTVFFSVCVRVCACACVCVCARAKREVLRLLVFGVGESRYPRSHLEHSSRSKRPGVRGRGR